jgi:holo-[acyl-carrier protein] synthase
MILREGEEPPRMISTGIDIESAARFEALIAAKRSLKMIFTLAEIEYSAARRSRALHLAGRFAAKEACAKALKTGFGSGVHLRDIEVVSAPNGRPNLKLSSRAAALLDGRAVFLSIAYAHGIAMALVLIED